MLIRPARFCVWNNGVTLCYRRFAKYVSEKDWLDLRETTTRKDFGLPVQPDFDLSDLVVMEGDKVVSSATERLPEFSELQLDGRVLQNIGRIGFKRMTPVQLHTFRALAAGKDVMACSETGSGKTHAFLIPIANAIVGAYPRDAMEYSKSTHFRTHCPSALILAPSRSMASQLRKEADRVFLNTAAAVVHLGNRTKQSERKELMKGFHFLIGTPSQVIRAIERRDLTLKFCRYLVVDEVDYLLKIDNRAMRKIIFSPEASLPTTDQRRTVACTATMPPGAEVHCRELLAPGYRKIMPHPLDGSPIPNCITQEFLWAENEDHDYKTEHTISLLNKLGDEKVIIFGAVPEITQLNTILVQRGFKPVLFVPNKRSAQKNAMNLFEGSETNIMLCHGSVGIGLDFRNVTHIINYRMSPSVDNYIHRVGRAGRMGQRGVAVTFFGPKDMPLADELVIMLDKCGVTPPDFLFPRWDNE